MRSKWVLAAILVMLCAGIAGRTTHAAGPKRVIGNLVFWDQARGFDAILANADVFSEVSPFWYRVEADGLVVPFTTGLGTSYEDPVILSFLRSRGILVIPTVANVLNGVWDGTMVSGILADSTVTAVNISSLVQLAVANGYDGIDLDYENLAASDRTAFTNFTTQLAAALHANGKVLTVNVYAKTAEPGDWAGPQAQDWWALGQVVDQVRIMTYRISLGDFSTGASLPGRLGERGAVVRAVEDPVEQDHPGPAVVRIRLGRSVRRRPCMGRNDGIGGAVRRNHQLGCRECIALVPIHREAHSSHSVVRECAERRSQDAREYRA